MADPKKPDPFIVNPLPQPEKRKLPAKPNENPDACEFVIKLMLAKPESRQQQAEYYPKVQESHEAADALLDSIHKKILDSELVKDACKGLKVTFDDRYIDGALAITPHATSPNAAVSPTYDPKMNRMPPERFIFPRQGERWL